MVHRFGCDITFVTAAHLLHHHKEINPIQEWITESILIPLDLHFTASACFGLGEEVTAGAWVHCGNKHNIRFILYLGIDPCDMDFFVLQRFA